MKTFEELTGMYPVSKTLRFELVPIGKTADNIAKKGIIEQDCDRAEKYKKAKKIIDEFHKRFIHDSLCTLQLKVNSDGQLDSLAEYLELAQLTKRAEREEKEFKTIKDNLRKQITKAFKNNEVYDDLFKKELIQKRLPDFVSEDEQDIVENFFGFTTYFTGFHENRKNMYDVEEKSTAIAYRLINENLPTFISNITAFEAIACSEISARFPEIEQAFSDVLNVKSITDIFKLNYFSETLTQEQITVYNYIIGGKVTEEGTKIQGINEYVNLYNQQQSEKSKRLPKLRQLYKMILSDRLSLSWLPESFSSDEEMISAINGMYDSIHPLLSEEEGGLNSLLKGIRDFDTSKIYIPNDLSITDLSQHILGRHDILTNKIKDELKAMVKPTAKERKDPEAFEDRIAKMFKAIPSFSIAHLDSMIKEICPEEQNYCSLPDYFASLGAHDTTVGQGINILTQIEINHAEAQSVLNGKVKDLNQSEQGIKIIKDLLDSIKSLQNFIKPLLGNRDEIDIDSTFYSLLNEAWDRLGIVSPLYDKVRNWLTRKPYSTEKIKLNFENPQLLGGWDVNKEVDCSAVLLRKDGIYYLSIMDKNCRHAFDYDELPDDGECFEKIDYKLLPGANKMLPKVFFSNSRIEEFAPSTEIVESYEKGTHKKGPDFSLIDCHRLIDFFKDSIKKHEDWSKFPFNFSPTSAYNDISDFYKEVEQQGYMIHFRNVSERYINSLVEEGKIYLFKIWNKDFSENSKGKPNLHTIYWRMLFDEKNLKDVVYKLNGQAEVFYRKRSLSLDKTTVHKANVEIANKNVHNAKKSSTFEYDIIKDRRYTVDKFQFHVPITINFKATGRDNINSDVQEIIRHGGFSHIIGIDRGERNLLYLSLIDLKGHIIKQMSLNDIVNEYEGVCHTVNYKEMLATREGDRTEARRNWEKIENIKEIKEGYLSQVVHIIAKMMTEYHAIVVLEDLNMGFMRGRQKIERSVYEQFEKMLIDKLNCYIDKSVDADLPGGALNALQLTSKFESFKKMGKQSGCLFYIPAWNTSKIDPVTGFVNLLDTRYESIDKAKAFFSKFDFIRFNKKSGWFEFGLDYNKFTEKASGTRTSWTLCTYGTRIKTFRNPAKNSQWDNIEIDLTEEFKSAFADAGIDINGNLKNAICLLNDKQTFERLLALTGLMLQMRNSVSGTDIDYLLSPVQDDKGHFYDSRENIAGLPIDADANGAYNIARKGLWVIERIAQSSSEDKIGLTMTNKEWLHFAQQKPYLND